MRRHAVVISVLVACIALIPVVALAASPEDDAKAVAGKGPAIEVVVDRENGLALVPDGTVIPRGLRIETWISRGDGNGPADEFPELLARPLVFAYAPDERFASLRETVRRARAQAQKDEEPEVVFPGGGVAPMASTTVTTCPATVEVEFVPGVVHWNTCNRTQEWCGPAKITASDLYGIDQEDVVSWLFSGRVHNPPYPDNTYYGIQHPTYVHLMLGYCLPSPVEWVAYTAVVSIQGSCPPDNPKCLFFQNRVTFPIE